MRVAIRVDSGTAIGAGHLMRCLTLADELRDRGARIEFIARDHPGHLADIARARGYQVRLLPAGIMPTSEPSSWLGTTPLDDATASLNAAADLQPLDWIIVDHYAVDADWHRAVRPAARHVLAIDDLADRPLDADIVVDHNFGAETKAYETVTPSGATLLLGTKFALIDAAFAKVREETLRRSTVEHHDCRVVLSLGGSDANDATSWVIRTLHFELSAVAEVDVVIGQSHPRPDSVASAARSLPRSRVHVQTSRMAELLSKADLAIGAGGVATLERALLGVPTVAIEIAENQRSALSNLAAIGAVDFVRDARSNPDGLRSAFARLAHDTSRRGDMRTVARTLVDGAGARRVADEMHRRPLNAA